MCAYPSLALPPPASLERVHNLLGSLVARYRQEAHREPHSYATTARSACGLRARASSGSRLA